MDLPLRTSDLCIIVHYVSRKEVEETKRRGEIVAVVSEGGLVRGGEVLLSRSDVTSSNGRSIASSRVDGFEKGGKGCY